MKDTSVALLIPDFDYGGEEKRVVYFANSYLEHYKSVYLIAPAGKSDALLHSAVKRIIVNVRNPLSIVSILRFLKDEKIRVLQGHKRASLVYLFLAEKLLSARSFFNFDNIYLKHNKLCSYISPSRNIYLSDVLKEFYSPILKSKKNHTINMGGDMLQKYSVESVKTIRNELGIADRINVIISLGRLAPQKNHSLLLEALSILSHKDFICLVVGSGPLENTLKARAEELSLTDSVKFLGHRTDIERLLNISDLMVQSSIFEGFPNVFIEAVSVGIPIVSTEVGSARTLVKKNGTLVPSGNSMLLADAIDSVLTNLQQFKIAAEEMRNSVYFSQFSKDQMLKGYISYIDSLHGENEK